MDKENNIDRDDSVPAGKPALSDALSSLRLQSAASTRQRHLEQIMRRVSEAPCTAQEVAPDLMPPEGYAPPYKLWPVLASAAAGIAIGLLSLDFFAMQPSRDPGRTVSRAEPAPSFAVRDSFVPETTFPFTASPSMSLAPHLADLQEITSQVVTNRPAGQNWPTSPAPHPGNSGLLPASNPRR